MEFWGIAVKGLRLSCVIMTMEGSITQTKIALKILPCASRY